MRQFLNQSEQNPNHTKRAPVAFVTIAFQYLAACTLFKRSDCFIALLFVEKRPFECCFVNVANEFHRQFDAMTPSRQE